MSVDKQIITEYGVTGMTCEHCASAVRGEVGVLPAVSAVDVDVTAGHLRVTSSAPLERADVRAAVEEAGYTLVEG